MIYVYRAIKRSNCFHEKGHDNPCGVSGTPYMLMFGIVEILFSKIPYFDQISWLSMLATIRSFTYSSIGLDIGTSKIIGKFICQKVIKILMSLVSHKHW